MTASHRPPSRQGLGAPKLRSLPSGKPPQGEGLPAGPWGWPSPGRSPALWRPRGRQEGSGLPLSLYKLLLLKAGARA